MLIVKLEHDSDIECPSDNDGWKLYSFGRRHSNFKEPEELGLSLEMGDDGLPKVLNIGLRKKLEVGLAHFLSYFEHGQCLWFLHGTSQPGVEFQWDGVRVAGLLIWEEPPKNLGAKTLQDREKDAASFLDRYTKWANGEGYYYCVEKENGTHVDSCGGFDDADYMLTNIVDHLVGQEFEVQGDASYLENDLRKLVREKEEIAHGKTVNS